MRKKYKNLTKQKIDEIDKTLQFKITEIITELEYIQPNMHASDKYNNVVDKLQDCSDQLEVIKETARDVSLRFEEIKKLRQHLFQDCYNHVSESLGIFIYHDII